MKKILVIEDEPGIRMNLSLMLRAEGFAVTAAENGRIGVERAREIVPDLIISDVMMPELDGFGVLATLRADTRFGATPFIFLTALDDRANMRRGMNLGADDYLPKPFTRDELLDAVRSRLVKQDVMEQAISERMVEDKDSLRARFRSSLAGTEAEQPSQQLAAGETGKVSEATILFSDIRNFTTYSERLSASDTAEMLNAYYAQACQPIVRHGGRIAKFIGDGVMAVFEPGDGKSRGHHAERGTHAALEMVAASDRFRAWVAGRFPDVGLPEFGIGIGLHSGQVVFCHVGSMGRADWTAIGDSVNVASRLQGKTRELGWTIAASDAVINFAGPVRTGRREDVELKGRTGRIMAVELLPPQSDVVDEPSVELPPEVREALSANAQLAVDAARAALNDALSEITQDLQNATARGRTLRIKGFTILKKVGEGGMSSVYLARRDSNGEQLALKILDMKGSRDLDMFKRFVKEFTIMSGIDHRHVVKIYDQGSSDNYAFLAMEYFSGGTLKDVMARGLTTRQALSLLSQAASALAEIHRLGIVHRDIKPGNFMLREDGLLVLADFGVAKRIGDQAAQTMHGEAFGTPSYISPEQVEGWAVSGATDVYSLGAIFFEMLTGRKPYVAETLTELISMHLHAGVPLLPDTLSSYQPLLNQMMAKNPQERLQNGDDLLDEIDRAWSQVSAT
jgi:serine/threonine-protein kinase PpkA